MVRYRGHAPSDNPGPREASEPQPEPACDQEEAAGAGGPWRGRHRGGGLPWHFSLASHGVPVLSPTGHLTLPEGPDKEKDCVLRHGQLGATEPAQSYTSCPAGRWGCWRGPLAAHQACLHQLPRLCPPGSCSWLRARGRCCGPYTGMSCNVPKQTVPRVLFIAFLLPLPSQ